MKKVLKKLCFIAVLLSLFSSCENKISEYEYSVKSNFENNDEFGREVIIDNVYCFELDENNIILNKREIGVMSFQDKKTFTVSSCVSSVYVIYRCRTMNNNGSPYNKIHFKTKTSSLNPDYTNEIILNGYLSDIEFFEDEFYNLINNN